MVRWKQLDKNLYVCYACGSQDSYKDKVGATHWKINRATNGDPINMLCQRCHNRYVGNPKWNPIHNPKNNKRRYYFNGKVIYHEINPRKGVCDKCGKVGGKTDMHHERYDPNNPLAFTIELCSSCHRKRTIQLSHE